jgi:6-phosphogluconolactonase
MIVHYYRTAAETARALIRHIIGMVDEEPQKTFHIAFSGGTTPSLMFDLWADEYSIDTDWKRLHIYWVDERCVPADDSESNYGTMRRLLLDRVPIATDNVHPIRGERAPSMEVMRCNEMLAVQLPHKNGIPIFDLVLLGAGEDGHTSSIFPGEEALLTAPTSYAVSKNPHNGQVRVAMTGNPLVAADRTFFLITGKAKEQVVRDIISSGDIGPAAYVAHHARCVELFTDVRLG